MTMPWYFHGLKAIPDEGRAGFPDSQRRAWEEIARLLASRLAAVQRERRVYLRYLTPEAERAADAELAQYPVVPATGDTAAAAMEEAITQLVADACFEAQGKDATHRSNRHRGREVARVVLELVATRAAAEMGAIDETGAIEREQAAPATDTPERRATFDRVDALAAKAAQQPLTPRPAGGAARWLTCAQCGREVSPAAAFSHADECAPAPQPAPRPGHTTDCASQQVRADGARFDCDCRHRYTPAATALEAGPSLTADETSAVARFTLEHGLDGSQHASLKRLLNGILAARTPAPAPDDAVDVLARLVGTVTDRRLTPDERAEIDAIHAEDDARGRPAPDDAAVLVEEMREDAAYLRRVGLAVFAERQERAATALAAARAREGAVRASHDAACSLAREAERQAAMLHIHVQTMTRERDEARAREGAATEAGARLVLEHFAKHFDVLVEVCEKNNSPYTQAYRNAAEDCRTVLTGGYGWMLDLQQALRAALRPASDDAAAPRVRGVDDPPTDQQIRAAIHDASEAADWIDRNGNFVRAHAVRRAVACARALAAARAREGAGELLEWLLERVRAGVGDVPRAWVVEQLEEIYNHVKRGV